MSTPSRRNEALLAKSLALAFWLAGWTLVLIALVGAVYVLVDVVRSTFAPPQPRWQVVVLGYASAVLYGTHHLAAAVGLLAVSRGVLLAHEALGYLRTLTGQHGYERPVAAAGPPLTISRALLSIYRVLVRFRNFGRFKDTEE